MLVYVGKVRSSTFLTHTELEKYQHLTGRWPHAMSFSSWAFQHPCRSQANPRRSELMAFILSEVVGVISVLQIQQTALSVRVWRTTIKSAHGVLWIEGPCTMCM